MNREDADMLLMYYFSLVFWLVPSILVGYAVHSGLIGISIYVGAVIIQTWISGITYLIRGDN